MNLMRTSPGILEYQSETETCYNQDWDAFYGYIRESMRSDFSKAQIMGKCLVLKEEDVPCAENERVVGNENTKIDNVEEEDGADDLCVIKNALEAAASYRSLSEDLRKVLFRKLKNVGADRRKELADGWKALFAADMELDIKKRDFFAMLLNLGFSA
ncbi:hypothetical protein CARUB_v10007629mg [Capsella rubella]|uniref:Uncharacterized protein n=1 Tax=Capsella rubella TaxID=81985 RepID=R0GQ38_9BRAS|nr:hypothetical protein CARUB_v10007629mg [Capsella rubella]